MDESTTSFRLQFTCPRPPPSSIFFTSAYCDCRETEEKESALNSNSGHIVVVTQAHADTHTHTHMCNKRGKRATRLTEAHAGRSLLRIDICSRIGSSTTVRGVKHA